MIVRTVEQVRRAFRIVAGFTLLLAGVVMIVTPGPGWLVIFLGLSLLAAEFIWARRLMDRMKRQGDRVREAVWPAEKNVPPEQSVESKELEQPPLN
jgi:tellurite resistance protein TerC